jgi:hypothetical protein
MTTSTRYLDLVLGAPRTSDYGSFTLASKELDAIKALLTNADRLDAQRRAMRVELEFCARTFAAMSGSGPAHANRIRSLFNPETFDRGIDRLDPWRRLFACAIAFAFTYRFAEGSKLSEWLDDDVTAAGMNQLENAVVAVAKDRGEVTFERWAQAALETFEHELEDRGKALSKPAIARYQAHVDVLRARLASKVPT